MKCLASLLPWLRPPGIAVLLLATRYATAQVPAASTLSGPAPETMPLEPLFRIQETNGRVRFLTRQNPGFEKLKPRLGAPVFLAVVTSEWLTGFVPIFAVEKAHGMELRRRALSGEENNSEPLFFALPPEDEPDAGRIAGRWECVATRGPDSRNHLVWELAIEAGRISGRFDQNSEYRVAFLTGGAFRSNRIELNVEYLQDKYVLTGDWRDGRFRGDWRRTDDGERGTWEATRAPGPPLPVARMVRLYEWRRSPDNARDYAVEGVMLPDGWTREPRPLCRVWRAADEPSKGLKPPRRIP